MNSSRMVIVAALVAGCVGGVVGSLASSGCVKAESQPAAPAAKQFEGYGDGLSFDKAVADAVTKAFADLSKSPSFPAADGMLRFTVTEIGGERGGIAGLNRVRVKITATP
ncbi:MAG: hypothetical protein HYR85_06865 [Planctomycetes bacterium]|nr:hypothetical protein [Planctomycetota bacterium]MBI3845227.1 hypothetical protein [Planctomycetota bacterium]